MVKYNDGRDPHMTLGYPHMTLDEALKQLGVQADQHDRFRSLAERTGLLSPGRGLATYPDPHFAGVVLNQADAHARVDRVMSIDRQPPADIIDHLSLIEHHQQTPLTSEEIEALRIVASHEPQVMGTILQMLGVSDKTVPIHNPYVFRAESESDSPDIEVKVVKTREHASTHSDPKWAAKQQLQLDELTKRLSFDYKEPHVGQRHIFVKDMQVRYTNPGGSYAGIQDSSRFAMREEMEVQFTVVLPQTTNPNDFLNWLKTSAMTANPVPVAEGSSEIRSLRSQLDSSQDQIKKLKAELEAQGTKTAQLLIEADRAKQAMLEEGELAKKTLVQLRERMSQAIMATRDTGVARELYNEALGKWSESLAEGASFTAAEGQELVNTLVEMLQYMDVSRKLAGEEAEKVSPRSKKKKQQLF